MIKKKLLTVALAALVMVLDMPITEMSAKAGSHSKKAIQAVTHAGFGGGTDVTTRMMLLRARRVLKQDMQLVNKKVVVVLCLWTT